MVFIKTYITDPTLITRLTRNTHWCQQYTKIWKDIGICILKCTHLDCRYANYQTRRPCWKRFPLRSLFPMLGMGRPSATEHHIQRTLEKYVRKMMIPPEEWQEADKLQMDKLLSNGSGIPCSRCWNRNEPGYTRFWTYLNGDRVLPNPKSILEQLAKEFNKTKTTKRERAERILAEFTRMVDEKFTTTAQSHTVVGVDPISPPDSGFKTIAEKYFSESKYRALWLVSE